MMMMMKRGRSRSKMMNDDDESKTKMMNDEDLGTKMLFF